MSLVRLLALLCASARAWNATCAPRVPCLRGLHERPAAPARPRARAARVAREPRAGEPCFGLARAPRPRTHAFARRRGAAAAGAGPPTLCQLHVPRRGAISPGAKRFVPGLGDALARAPLGPLRARGLAARAARGAGGTRASRADDRVLRYGDEAPARARVVWPFYGHGHAALSHPRRRRLQPLERYRGERAARRDAGGAAERARLVRDCPLSRVATMVRGPKQRLLSDPLHHFTSQAARPSAFAAAPRRARRAHGRGQRPATAAAARGRAAAARRRRERSERS